MAIKSVITASSLTGEAFESVDVDFSDSDSDSWQVIDASDSDDGNFSYGDVTTTDDEDDDVVPDVDDLLQHPFGSPLSDVSMQSTVDEIANQLQEVKHAYEIDHIRQIIDGGGFVEGEDDLHREGEDDLHRENEDESDQDEDDEDLDVELVPKWLNNKFEPRMRKLGKRAYPKMKKIQTTGLHVQQTWMCSWKAWLRNEAQSDDLIW